MWSRTWDLNIEPVNQVKDFGMLSLSLCKPVDCSLPSSSVHEISQAGILEWVAISYSKGYSWTHVSCVGRWILYHWATWGGLKHLMYMYATGFSHARLLAILWTITSQAPLSMGFSRQEYCGGFPCPPPGDLPDPGIEPISLVIPALQVDSLLLSHWRMGKPLLI